jgi:hypothetical protein
MTSRKRSKNGGDCETDVYMGGGGTNSRVVAANRRIVSFMIFTASVRNILNIPSCMSTDGQAAIMKAFFTVCANLPNDSVLE